MLNIVGDVLCWCWGWVSGFFRLGEWFLIERLESDGMEEGCKKVCWWEIILSTGHCTAAVYEW